MRQRSFLILSALTLLIASCGNKGGKSGLLVPKDAAIVVHINSSSLSSKISWEEIRQTNWFKEISKETTDTMAQQLLANPGSSGIDTKDDLVFYMKKQGRGSYLIFQGSLTDAGSFEKFIIEMNKGKEGEVKKEGDFNYVHSREASIVWNKSQFACIGNANVSGMKTPFEGNRSSYEEKYKFQPDSLQIFGQQALTLKADDNLDNDSRFASLLKDGSDIHVWMNLAQYYKGMGSMLSMMNMNVLMKDNVTATSLNFDNGRILAKSKQYYGEEMNKLLARHKPEPVSADVINRIPSENVAAVFAFNYPPKGLQEFLKVLGVDGIANGFLSRLDYSVEEFIKANKGEVLVAVSDLGISPKTDTAKTENGESKSPSAKTAMKILFATAVNDKAAFEKLITIAWESSKGMGKIPQVNYKLENSWFAASNSAEHTDKFLAGGNNKFSFTEKISGHPMGAYVDLQKIIQMARSSGFKDSSVNTAIDASLKMWQDITATGGEYKEKALQFEFEINLVDKNTNSLKQLNQYFDKLSVLRGEKLKDLHVPDGNRESASSDTLTIAPPETR